MGRLTTVTASAITSSTERFLRVVARPRSLVLVMVIVILSAYLLAIDEVGGFERMGCCKSLMSDLRFATLISGERRSR